MKKQVTIILLLVLGLAINSFAQSTSQDLIVIGAVAGDQNMQQVKMRYKMNPHVVFIQPSSQQGMEQISKALSEKQFVDIHFFVKENALGLNFSDEPLTIANIDKYTSELGLWKKSVSGGIIIHNQSGVTSDSLSELITKLEELTGLEVVVKQ